MNDEKLMELLERCWVEHDIRPADDPRPLARRLIDRVEHLEGECEENLRLREENERLKTVLREAMRNPKDWFTILATELQQEEPA